MNRSASMIVVAPLALLLGCTQDTMIDAHCEASTEGLQSYTVAVSASGLQDDEGATVYVRTAIGLAFREGACWAETTGRITDAGFALVVENLTDEAVYPTASVYIDRNEDGVCDDATDPSWHSNIALDADIELDAAAFAAPGENPGEGCEGFTP